MSGRVWRLFRRDKRVRRGRVALCECREWPGDFHGGQVGMERSSRRDSKGREAFPEGQKSRAGSGGPPGGPGEVKRPSWSAEWGEEPLPEGRVWLEGPPGGPREVERPSKRAGRGWEALLVGWQWSGGLSGGSGGLDGVRKPYQSTGGVGRLFHMSGRVREGQQVSGGPPGGPLVVRRPTRMDGRDREVLPEGWEASRGPLRGLGVVCRPIRRAVRSREWLGGPSGWL